MVETNGQDSVAQPTEPAEIEPTEAEVDVRSHKAFKAVTSQLSEARAKLEAIQAEQRQKAETEERQKLEEQGRYQELLAKRETEIEDTKKRYDREILQRDIKDALRDAGASNNIFMSGAIASYNGDRDGIKEYIDTLKEEESNKYFFGIVDNLPVGHSPPTHGTASTRSTNVNWSQVKAWESGSDPEKRKEARMLIRDYKEKNGEYPYKL